MDPRLRAVPSGIISRSSFRCLFLWAFACFCVSPTQSLPLPNPPPREDAQGRESESRSGHGCARLLSSSLPCASSRGGGLGRGQHRTWRFIPDSTAPARGRRNEELSGLY